MNSIFYTALSVIIKVSLTISGGYALSRKDLPGKGMFMKLIVFTMFFNGGLIPSYLLVKNLGMINTVWALVVPTAISVYNLIIVRTFFQSTIPDALWEAASMDGCNHFSFFFKVALPLSLPIIAVIALFSAVAEWNSYFQALIYLRNEKMYPLQLILREILIQNQGQNDMLDASLEALERQKAAEQIKYGVILVASVPMLILYPFLQKYFVKGVMIGSLKG
jgi:putative aldouronate transport system permease protein